MFTVAKSLPRSCRNLQKTQNLLVLCSPQCNHVQQRNVFWRKNFVWNEDMKFNLYKDYDFSYEGIKGMLLNKTRKAYEKEQGYLEARVNMLGPDIAAAEMILLWKGKVKFVDDEIWYEAYESGQLPLPKQYDPGYRLEAVDLSNTNWTLLAMEHFRYLDHLVYVNLSGAQFVTDWYVERLVSLCPTIECLDLEGCQGITDMTLELVSKIRHMKVLNIKDCTNIKQADVFSVFLEDFCPDIQILGLDSLPKLKTSLHEYEHSNSRFLNLGESARHHNEEKKCEMIG